MINISTVGFPHFASESYLISIWALIEKASSLLCCFKSEYWGYPFAIWVLFCFFISFGEQIVLWKHALTSLKLGEMWARCAFLGPVLTFEDWKQITLDEVISLEHLLKACFLTYCTHISFSSEYLKWLLNFLDLLADFLVDTAEIHPLSSGWVRTASGRVIFSFWEAKEALCSG